MTIEDSRTLDPNFSTETDLCIVGSGFAGWTIAEELRDSGLRVLILESGGLEPEPDLYALNQTEDVGWPLINGRERTLGGTSHCWGGRCRPLDDIDFEERPHVPFSGWPLASGSLAPFIDRASEYLGFAPQPADLDGSAPNGMPGRARIDTELLRTVCWQEPKPVQLAPLFRADPRPSRRIIVNATVTHLNTNLSGERLESIEFADPQGRRGTVRARAAVLCAGGIESARILLYSNRTIPNGLGNAYDAVGRFLMDHPRDPNMLVHFDTRDARQIRGLFGPHRLDNLRGRHTFVYGLALSPDRQRREGLLNCAAWPFEVNADDDPVEAVKRLVARPRARGVVRDAMMVVSQPGFVMRAVGASLLRDARVEHKVDRIGFLATSEQRPDPDSRIWLSERRDPLGLPVPKIDWRISADEMASQAALAQSIASEFRRLGLPRVRLADWVQEGRYEDAVFVDSCHPSGATRMASDPRFGVVDADCQVHSVAGLYVAGSSVFPTVGHANPTLMIVALAIRLARHLKERLSPSFNPAVRSPSERRSHAEWVNSGSPSAAAMHSRNRG